MDKHKPIESRAVMISRILEVLSIDIIASVLSIQTGWTQDWPQLLTEASTEKLLELRSLVGDTVRQPIKEDGDDG